MREWHELELLCAQSCDVVRVCDEFTLNSHDKKYRSERVLVIERNKEWLLNAVSEKRVEGTKRR